MGQVSGRSCIITGAAQGIDRAVGEALREAGADVCFADINATKASEVARANAERADAGGGKVMHAGADVTNRDSVLRMIDEVAATYGRLDVMFNNAGVNKPANLLDVTEENWPFVMDINGLGVTLGMQEATRRVIAQGAGGKIIDTASVASRQGFANVAPYSASNWAVVSLTQSGTKDLAEHDVTVTGFAPGVVATGMWEEVDRDLMRIGAADRPGQAMEEFASGILRGRVAQPHDITGTTTFLASSYSDCMTGQIIMTDGGMTLV